MNIFDISGLEACQSWQTGGAYRWYWWLMFASVIFQ